MNGSSMCVHMFKCSHLSCQKDACQKTLGRYAEQIYHLDCYLISPFFIVTFLTCKYPETSFYCPLMLFDNLMKTCYWLNIEAWTFSKNFNSLQLRHCSTCPHLLLVSDYPECPRQSRCIYIVHFIHRATQYVQPQMALTPTGSVNEWFAVKSSGPAYLAAGLIETKDK